MKLNRIGRCILKEQTYLRIKIQFTSGNQHEFDVPRDHKNIVEAAIHNGEYYIFSSLEFSKNTPPVVVNTKFIEMYYWM